MNYLFSFYKNDFIRTSRLKFGVKMFQKLRKTWNLRMETIQMKTSTKRSILSYLSGVRMVWEYGSKLRTSEPSPKFTGSYKKECRILNIYFWVAKFMQFKILPSRLWAWAEKSNPNKKIVSSTFVFSFFFGFVSDEEI